MADIDTDAGLLHVERARREGPDGMTFGDPKAGSKRTLALDAGLLDGLRLHRKAQAEERLRAGPAWRDHDLVVCTTIGSPLDRAQLRRRLIALTEAAGLGRDWHPTDLRRSYASLAALAGRSDAEIGADLGHRPGSRITLAHYVRDLRPVRGREGGEAVAKLLEEAAGRP